MASSSGEHIESDKEKPLPQISPDKGTDRKRMRGTAKISKPPKALKKKGEHELENVLGEIVEKFPQPDDDNAGADTEEQGLFLEDRPRRGGHGR